MWNGMPNETPQPPQDRKPLSRVDHIRKRPGMYLGRTDNDGLLQCVEEVLASIYQKHSPSRFNRIEVILHPDGSVSIGSNDDKIVRRATNLKQFLERLEAEFSQWVDHAFPCVLGEAGVGPSCVNALSEWLQVRVSAGTQIYEGRFCRGKISRPFHGTQSKKRKPHETFLVRFKPDAEIFRDATIEFKRLAWRLREIAFLTPGLRIQVLDRRKPKADVSYYHPKGLGDFLEAMSASAARIHAKPLILAGSHKGVTVEIGLQFDTSQNFQLFSYVNFRATHYGGTDIEGLLNGIASAIDAHGFNKPSKRTPDSVRFGLTAVLNVKLKNPMYYGATKERLVNPEVFDAVQSVVFRGLKQNFKGSPEIHKAIWLHLDANEFWVEIMRKDIHR